VKRHRHHDYILEPVTGGLPHQRAKGRCERRLAAVFERVDDVAQWTFVQPDGACVAGDK
jgi:hypothetical protein